MKAKSILFFIESVINHNKLDWGAYYGDCGQSWHDLYGSEDESIIERDHITIDWPAHTNNPKLYSRLLEASDKRTLDKNGRLMFHIFIDE